MLPPPTFTLRAQQTCPGCFPMLDEQGIGRISKPYAEGEEIGSQEGQIYRNS